MDRNKIKSIGGEFNIDPLWLVQEKPFLKYPNLFSSGRAGLFAILNSIRGKDQNTNILLPDYLCEVIIKTVEDTDLNFTFYRLNRNLHPDLDNLGTILKKSGKKSGIVLINYFGLLDLEDDIAQIKKMNKDIFVILDNVQALFQMNKKTKADFKFTSFRKTLPLPDGGYVIGHLNKFNINEENTFAFYKTIGGLIKHFKQYMSIQDKTYLNFFLQGEEKLDKKKFYHAPMSEISYLIWSHLNLKQIEDQRKKNFTFLKNKLIGKGIKPIIDLHSGAVPLFFPILIKNRDTIRKMLMEQNIFCPIHWPVNKKYKNQLFSGSNNYEHELSLVIDQRYNEMDMERLIKNLEKLKVESVN